jgi:large subunit ribosomal protein L21
MYAMVKTGGKQYKVAVGDVILIEKIDKPVGEKVELDQVLMVYGEDGIQVGQPVIANAKVVGEIMDQVRGEKIRGFVYKRRKKYRKAWGHRQDYTQFKVQEIKAN